MLLMVISIVPFALAEEDNEGSEASAEETEAEDGAESEQENESGETGEADNDEETETQIELMNKGIGAEVRLLQLEKVITRNILKAEEVISAVTKKGGDASELEALKAELEAVKEEVQALDPEAEDAVQNFVDLKSDAIDLSKQFRDKAKELLSKEDAAALRIRLKEIDREELKNINEEIKNKVREFNVEQLKKTYEILGIEDTSLIDQYANGEATLKDIRAQIKEQLQSMSEEERKTAISKLKEAGVKRVVTAKAAIEKVKLKALERKEAR